MAVVREFWLHKPSGRVWAVEVEDGEVVGVAGPVRARDTDPVLLDHLPYDSRDVPWVTRNRREFVRLEK